MHACAFICNSMSRPPPRPPPPPSDLVGSVPPGILSQRSWRMLVLVRLLRDVVVACRHGDREALASVATLMEDMLAFPELQGEEHRDMVARQLAVARCQVGRSSLPPLFLPPLFSLPLSLPPPPSINSLPPFSLLPTPLSFSFPSFPPSLPPSLLIVLTGYASHVCHMLLAPPPSCRWCCCTLRVVSGRRRRPSGQTGLARLSTTIRT